MNAIGSTARKGRTGALVHAATVGIVLSIFAACGGSGDSGDPAAARISTFSKSYGGSLHDEARVVLPAEDGGFLLFGSANAQNESTFVQMHRASIFHDDAMDVPHGGDFWIQKLDANGNVEYGRVIGAAATQDRPVEWGRLRATADGGMVVAGTTDGDDVDIAVTRFDSAGGVLWTVTHDSGAWTNYDYFARAGAASTAARDHAEDIWPTSDGGFVVIARSFADLEDRLGIGFSCDQDLVSAEVIDCDPSFGAEPQSGFRFVSAVSVVVFRLNADGSLRWTRRIADAPFDADTRTRAWQLSGAGLEGLVRSTADDGVILVHQVGWNHLLVRRLLADGSPAWRTTLEPLEDDRTKAVDLIQTDDPVDGSGHFDRLPDDGFALAVTSTYELRYSGSNEDRVIKLDTAGGVEWTAELSGPESEDRVAVNSIAQHCDYGREPHCDIVAVGGALAMREGSGGPVAFVALLDGDGDTRSTALAFDSANPQSELATRFLRVINVGGRIEVLGHAYPSEVRLAELQITSSGIALANFREGFEVPPDSIAELRPGRGAAFIARVPFSEISSDTLQQLMVANADGQLDFRVNLGDSRATEALRVAVQIGRGSYVLAGPQHSPDGRGGVLVVRYDLTSTGGRTVWQRVFYPEDLHADIFAAAPAADGGVVLGTYASTSLRQRNPFSLGRLLKLDANGEPQWETHLSGLPLGLQRMPDGGFALRIYRDTETSFYERGEVVFAVARVTESGDISWTRDVSLEEDGGGVGDAMVVAEDGTMLLAGRGGSRRLNFVRMSATGELIEASRVTLDVARVDDPSRIERDLGISDLHMAAAPDGGFVLAMSEEGVIRRRVDAEHTETYGQTNLLVMKVDGQLQPAWTQVYGGLLNETARDLFVDRDGVIAVAGASESLGDRMDAWLLKLSPQGLVSESGCQAHLTSMSISGMGSGPIDAFVETAYGLQYDEESLSVPLQPSSLPVRETPQFITARQCLGDASAGGNASSPVARRRLTVVQLGSRPGVVTSTPTGISCGTGLNICSSDFAQGTRVVLRADSRATWRTPCEEGSGGTSEECVVLLGNDQTIEVEFGVVSEPPPPAERFMLSFAVQGPGVVRTPDGIECSEMNNGAAACSREYPAGAMVNVTAVPEPGGAFLGWSGDSVDSICRELGQRTDVQITVTGNLRCYAQFAPAPSPPPPPPPPTGSTLDVLIVNGASGRRVESQPAGILCTADPGSDCRETFAPGATILLQASPQGFLSWQGCDAVMDVNFCSVTMNQSRGVTATFSP